MFDEMLNNFSLDSDAASILITLQKDLVDFDIAETITQDKKEEKTSWRISWLENIRKSIDELKKLDSNQRSPRFFLLKEYEKKIIEKENISNKELLLLELVCFQPYFNLNEEKKKSKQITVDPKLRKKYLKRKARELGIKQNMVDAFEASLNSTQQILANSWLKAGIKAGIGIPLIAGAAGYGVLFYLDLLGSTIGYGGISTAGISLSPNGKRISKKFEEGGAEKSQYLFGGGPVIDIGSKISERNALLKIDSNEILLRTIKSDVVFQEIMIKEKNRKSEAKQYLKTQSESIEYIKSLLDNSHNSVNICNQQLKDLKRSYEIIERSYQRNQQFYRNTI